MTNIIIKCLFVGLGGFLGSVSRYLLSLAMSPLSMVFPFGTMLINIIGAFFIGILSETALKYIPINTNLMLFCTVGLCGGFTTFSTFSLETFNLIEKGKILIASGYAIASVFLCLLGVFTGKFLIRSIIN